MGKNSLWFTIFQKKHTFLTGIQEQVSCYSDAKFCNLIYLNIKYPMGLKWPVAKFSFASLFTMTLKRPLIYIGRIPNYMPILSMDNMED